MGRNLVHSTGNRRNQKSRSLAKMGVFYRLRMRIGNKTGEFYKLGMRIINMWACFTNCACALLMNGRAFAKASTEISEKSSGNQKSERDFEISYAKTARVGPLVYTSSLITNSADSLVNQPYFSIESSEQRAERLHHLSANQQHRLASLHQG